MRPAGRPAHQAASGQRQPRRDRSDRQFRPHPHGCDPSVPAAAGRPHNTSTTRRGCGPAAIPLRSGATRHPSGVAASDQARHGTTATNRTHPRPAHHHPGTTGQPDSRSTGGSASSTRAPLAPRTARAIDLAVGERVEGPIFCGPDGQRLDRHGAARVVRRVASRGGITKLVGPHTLRHAFITAAQFRRRGSAARCPGSASHADPRTTMRYVNSRQSRPPRQLHRRRLPRRSRLVADLTGHKQTPPGQTAAARWSPGSRGNRIPARNRP